MILTAWRAAQERKVRSLFRSYLDRVSLDNLYCMKLPRSRAKEEFWSLQFWHWRDEYWHPVDQRLKYTPLWPSPGLPDCLHDILSFHIALLGILVNTTKVSISDPESRIYRRNRGQSTDLRTQGYLDIVSVCSGASPTPISTQYSDGRQHSQCRLCKSFLFCVDRQASEDEHRENTHLFKGLHCGHAQASHVNCNLVFPPHHHP